MQRFFNLFCYLFWFTGSADYYLFLITIAVNTIIHNFPDKGILRLRKEGNKLCDKNSVLVCIFYLTFLYTKLGHLMSVCKYICILISHLLFKYINFIYEL